MSEKIKATGLESAIISHWSGWDGDGIEWMCFYDVKLIPEIYDALKTYCKMPKGIVDLEVESQKLLATVRIYDTEQDNKEIFSHEIKLTVGTEAII